MNFNWRLLTISTLVLLISACAHHPVKTGTTPPSQPSATSNTGTSSNPPASGANVVSAGDFHLLKSAQWSAIANFNDDDLAQAWPAWMQACSTLINKAAWNNACLAANQLNNPTNIEIQNYYEQYFNLYQATNTDGGNTGLITGYYEPLLNGSRSQSDKYPYALYRQPDDLVMVNASNNPNQKFKLSRGRYVNSKLVPYYTRAQIEANPSPLKGNELIWVDNIIDAFFLQVQGSGLVNLDTGEQLHIGYANQNGYTYNSIGKVLIHRKELTADQASMQGIKNWAANNPTKLRELLNNNPSYIFFKEMPATTVNPIGALGIPLTPERSVAVDKKYVPLGAPIFLSTTLPNSSKPLNRLMMAQDTGGAIKGSVRADFYWGTGDDAGKQAGAMKQKGKIWVLLPKEFVMTR